MIYLNPDDEERVVHQAKKLYEAVFTKSDRVLNCFPGEPAVSGYSANLTLSALGYTFKHIQPQKIKENTQKFVEEWKEFTPSAFMSLTTFAYRLPLIFESFGVDAKNLGLNRIVTAAEPSTIERRKIIGEGFGGAFVYDLYATSENCVIAYETEPFSDEHLVVVPETLMFMVKNKEEVTEGEVGDILLTNLYELGAKPWMILLNYKIGDWAKCLEKEESGIVTNVSNIRREAAYLGGAKLDPTEVEKAIEELGELKNYLTGEYCIINYYDKERKAIGEIRIESRKKLEDYEKRNISKKLRERIYSVNFPVWNEVENIENAKLLIEIVEPGELYKRYEHFIKPGKPKRLITLDARVS